MCLTTFRSNLLPACLGHYCLEDWETRFSETLETTFKITLRHKPQQNNQYFRRLENLRLILSNMFLPQSVTQNATPTEQSGNSIVLYNLIL
jgi:hypothetical protein